MANERPGSRWQPRLPGASKRIAGSRRAFMPRLLPPVSVLRDWERTGLRDMLRAFSTGKKRTVAYAAGAITLATGVWLAFNSAPLSIQDVDVTGTNVLSEDLIRDTADIGDNNLARPDLDGARERLLALPMVRKASVERDWPLGVDITIVERKAWGVWRAGGERYVIDVQGVVLAIEGGLGDSPQLNEMKGGLGDSPQLDEIVPAPDGAPLIIQTGAADSLKPGDRVAGFAVPIAAKLLATAPQTLGRQVTKLQYSDADGLTLLMSSESQDVTLRVLFGYPQDYDFKVAALYAILRKAAGDGRTVRSVDLRFGQKVAVKWGEAA